MTISIPLTFAIIMLIVIIIAILIAWPHLKGAPWIPSRMNKVREMLSLAEIKPEEIVYDLGCGDGRIILHAVRKYQAKAVGIEINLILYLWCQFLISVLRLRKRVKVIYGNFFKEDLSNADIVICYLLQDTNDKLENKLNSELKSSARVISNSFLFHNLRLTNENSEKGIYVYKR
jgi:SAM-dependent methyltransferase